MDRAPGEDEACALGILDGLAVLGKGLGERESEEGEVTMGVKLENRRSAQVCEEVLSVPGLAFCEPGPSDNGLSHLGWDAVREDITPAQRAALPAQRQLEVDLERIRLAAKANNIRWLGNGPPGATPEQQIDQGRRMGPAGSEQNTQADRLYTKRRMPY